MRIGVDTSWYTKELRMYALPTVSSAKVLYANVKGPCGKAVLYVLRSQHSHIITHGCVGGMAPLSALVPSGPALSASQWSC